jgi:hypothetical protein
VFSLAVRKFPIVRYGRGVCSHQMGGIVSKNPPAPSGAPSFQARGSSASKNSQEAGSAADESSRSEWKMLLSVDEAKQKFQNDGTLIGNIDAGHLELRILLDEPLGQQFIGEYAKSIHTSESFMCWIDLLEFKSIPSDACQYWKSKAHHIFQKYIRAGAVSEFGGITDVDREKYRELVFGENSLPSDCFDKLQTQCFEDIYENTFKRFQTTEPYTNLKTCKLTLGHHPSHTLSLSLSLSLAQPLKGDTTVSKRMTFGIMKNLAKAGLGL